MICSNGTGCDMWSNEPSENKKACSRCGVEKPHSDFYRLGPGRGRKARLFSACKKCSDLAVKLSTEKNPEITKKAKQRQYYEYRKNKPLHWAKSTTRNHALRGFRVEIDRKELGEKAKNTPTCFFCGVELRWSREDGDPVMCNETPTLDRMDNEKTLTMENTEIVCLLCNSTKRNRTFKEFIDYCKLISDKFGE